MDQDRREFLKTTSLAGAAAAMTGAATLTVTPAQAQTQTGKQIEFADRSGSIYLITRDGDLLWYGDMHRDGTPGWAPNSGNRIGWGWQDVRIAFSGGEGINSLNYPQACSLRHASSREAFNGSRPPGIPQDHEPSRRRRCHDRRGHADCHAGAGADPDGETDRIRRPQRLHLPHYTRWRSPLVWRHASGRDPRMGAEFRQSHWMGVAGRAHRLFRGRG